MPPDDKPVDIVGYIRRTHGAKGELQVVFKVDEQILDAFVQNLETLFLLIDGIATPFFVESIRRMSGNTLIVKFLDYDTPEAVQVLVGTKVLLNLDEWLDADGLDWSDLLGFDLYEYVAPNVPERRLGTIVGYQDYGTNGVLLVQDIAPNNNQTSDTEALTDCPQSCQCPQPAGSVDAVSKSGEGRTWLVPAAYDLLVGIDDVARSVSMRIPDGLLDLD